MKLPKLRELREAVTSLFRGPYTHPFPKAPTPVPDNLRGKPVYDPAGCIGCGACREICPARAIDIRDIVSPGRAPMRRIVLHYDSCIFCGECVRCCTTGEGISLSQEYELSGLDRREMVETVEKPLVLCEMCGGVVAPRDQLLQLYRRLGAAAFANPTLTLVGLAETGLEEPPPRDDRPLGRGDIQRVLCPACRRAVTQLEEWGPC